MERAIRAQLARGDLPAVKRGGRWRIERRHLPLTEPQRKALQARADTVRQAVEEALPSRLARTPGQKSRSLADLDAFRHGARLLAELRADDGGALAERERGLRLKHPQARVLSCHGHLDALGNRITRGGLRALARPLRRLQRRVVAEVTRPDGRPATVDFDRSVASSAGVVLF